MKEPEFIDIKPFDIRGKIELKPLKYKRAYVSFEVDIPKNTKFIDFILGANAKVKKGKVIETVGLQVKNIIQRGS